MLSIQHWATNENEDWIFLEHTDLKHASRTCTDWKSSWRAED